MQSSMQEENSTSIRAQTSHPLSVLRLFMFCTKRAAMRRLLYDHTFTLSDIAASELVSILCRIPQLKALLTGASRSPVLKACRSCGASATVEACLPNAARHRRTTLPVCAKLLTFFSQTAESPAAGETSCCEGLSLEGCETQGHHPG